MNSRLVVDASAVVQACLSEAGFGPLGRHSLVGPHLLASEALSALREGRFRGDISDALAGAARDRLRNAPIELLRPDGLADAAWTVAEDLGWAKTYDAEYVALARLLECPLLTVDARLARSAAQLVEVLGPADVST